MNGDRGSILGMFRDFDWFWVLIGFDLYHNDHWWRTTNQNRIWPALTWWCPKFQIISRGHGRSHSELGSNRDSLGKNKASWQLGGLDIRAILNFDPAAPSLQDTSHSTSLVAQSTHLCPIWAMARALKGSIFFWGKGSHSWWYPPVIKHG
jgi:hypothetical protein